MTRKRDELLEHDADGIREFDNDLPRWWLYGFYFTIVFGFAYLINYHVLATPIVAGGSVAAEYEAEVALAAATASTRAPGGAGATVALVALKDADSLAKGRAIFESQSHPCASCHRPDLGGLVGPNLTDEAWLHGCAPADVAQSIKNGYLTKGMLPFGGGPTLSDAEVLQLTSYILSRNGSNPPNAKAKDAERDVACK